MLTKIYSIHDAKAQAFLPPFYMHHDGQAIRVFTDCINSTEHQFSHHPADYTIFDIGTFDDENAEILSKTPKSLGNGILFVNPDKPVTEQPDNEISDETQLQPSSEG